MRHASTILHALLRVSAKRCLLTLVIGAVLLLALAACGASSAPMTYPHHTPINSRSAMAHLTNQIVFSTTLSGAAVISGVQADLLTLPVVTPDITIACPADVPDHYAMPYTSWLRGRSWSRRPPTRPRAASGTSRRQRASHPLRRLPGFLESLATTNRRPVAKELLLIVRLRLVIVRLWFGPESCNDPPVPSPPWADFAASGPPGAVSTAARSPQRSLNDPG